MSLTNQLFPNPLEGLASEKHPVKNFQFYNTAGNLWNNHSRMCKKIAKIVHRNPAKFNRNSYEKVLSKRRAQTEDRHIDAVI